jgi:hypothetical protein
MQVAILDAIRGDLGCELRGAQSLRAALDVARVLLAGRPRRLSPQPAAALNDHFVGDAVVGVAG